MTRYRVLTFGIRTAAGYGPCSRPLPLYEGDAPHLAWTALRLHPGHHCQVYVNGEYISLEDLHAVVRFNGTAMGLGDSPEAAVADIDPARAGRHKGLVYCRGAVVAIYDPAATPPLRPHNANPTPNPTPAAPTLGDR